MNNFQKGVIFGLILFAVIFYCVEFL